MEQTKICSYCGIEKPVSQFYKSSNKYTDGYQARCKDCQEQATKKYRSENPINRWATNTLASHKSR